jgi:hypothetical protein
MGWEICAASSKSRIILLLEMKPLRWLGVTLELSSFVVNLEIFCEECPLHLHKEKSRASELEKVVERDPTWSCPCEQLKFPQQSRRDHNNVFLNFEK